MSDQILSPLEGSAILHASLDGVGLLEGDTFVRANEELSATFGYEDPNAIVGTSWTELYPPDERNRIKQDVFPQVRAEPGWRGKARGIRADGSTFSQQLSICATDDGTEDGRLVWIVRDIGKKDAFGSVTNRVEGSIAGPTGNGRKNPVWNCGSEHDRTGECEAKLNEPPELDHIGPGFRQLFDSTPVPIAVFTAERGIVYCNRAAVELVGADEHTDVLGVEPMQFVHADHREQARQRIRQVIENREATEPMEYQLAGLNGQERSGEIAAAPLTYDGEPGAYVVINVVTPYERTRERLRRGRRFVETVIDAIDDIIYVLDEEGAAHLWNERLVATSGYSNKEIKSMHAKDFLPEDQHEYVPGLMQAIDSFEDQRVELDLLTKDGEEIPHEFKGTTFEDPETGEVFRCGVARNISERLERERRLERQRDELATLDNINRTLLETTRELVRSADQAAVEQTICDQLAASDLYEFAWIAERKFNSDHLVARTTAGNDRDYLDAIETESGDSEVEGGPAAKAMRTREVQVIKADDGEGGRWEDVAGECGSMSVAAVPLHHEGTGYGVLMIHTVRENAFNDRAQDDFDVLGRTVGFVINAVRSHDLLFSDTVVELELQLSGDGSLFASIGSHLECELELEGYVAPGRRWLLYLDVRDSRPEDVVSLATDDPSVERARVIESGDNSGRVELVVSAPKLLTNVKNVGATIQSLVAEPGGIRLIVEVPVDCDVREFLEPIRRDFPDTTLEARRDQNHEATTASHPEGPLGGLTDRQREALETAYRAGYFAWPRDSTADEVAESLDLASATLHGHLRKAEETILSALFDGG